MEEKNPRLLVEEAEFSDDDLSGAVGGVTQTSVTGAFGVPGKELDVEMERIRDLREQHKALNDSLKELVQKSIDTQNAIQQGMNQARSKKLP